MVELRYRVSPELNQRKYTMLGLIDAKNVSRETISEKNFFEDAMKLSDFIKNNGLTQENAALKLGMAQSTIANKLRLLRMSDDERSIITESKLTERHARALLRIGSSDERLKLIEQIIQNRMNVESSERLIDEYIRSNYKISAGPCSFSLINNE